MGKLDKVFIFFSVEFTSTHIQSGFEISDFCVHFEAYIMLIPMVY
jgi:hypothetical protein